MGGENGFWIINAGNNCVLSICVLLYRSEGDSSRSLRYVYIIWCLCSKKILYLKALNRNRFFFLMWALLVVLSMPLVFWVKDLLPWISYWMILSPVWFKSEGLVWIITKDLWLVPGAPDRSSCSTAPCTGEAENQLPASFGAASVLGGSPWMTSGFLSSLLFFMWQGEPSLTRYCNAHYTLGRFR